MALWQPEPGLWSVSNNPFGALEQLDCYYGAPGDLPIGGIGGLNLAPITGTGYRFSDLGIDRNGGLATAPLTPGLGCVFREPVASVPSNYAGVLLEGDPLWWTPRHRAESL